MKVFIKRILKLGLIICIFYLLIRFLSGYYSERVRDYIKQEATNSSTKLIEMIVRNSISSELESIEIVSVNEKGIIIDTKKVNDILLKTNETLLDNNDVFESIDDLELPLGIIFSDVLFNYGPNIKIKMQPISSGKTDVVTEVVEYGINNSLFRMDILVTMNFQTLIPLNNQEIVIESKVPLVTYVLQGEVPRYYSYGTPNVIPLLFTHNEKE